MKTLLSILAAVLASSGCKPESARKADRAADELNQQRKDVLAEPTDLQRVAKESGELVNAQQEFEFRRRHRVDMLRAQHAVVASQPMLISSMSRNFPLTDDGRAQINEKLTLLQMRLDDTKNMIEALRTTDASMWEERDDAIREAMEKLDDARRDAWKALEDAPRADRNAS